MRPCNGQNRVDKRSLINHMDITTLSLKKSLLNTTVALVTKGLNKGTSGNLSVRCEGGFLITPSGISPQNMTLDDIVLMDIDGSHEEGKKPSSEWRFHRDIFQRRSEVNAVVHAHSMFATTIACMQKEVPPFHYMIAVAGGDNIRCAPYALFGSQELSDYALDALSNRKACLLAHHGMIAVGHHLEDALAVAVEIENLCEQYWRLLQLGEPKRLSKKQMEAVQMQFKGYGSWKKS